MKSCWNSTSRTRRTKADPPDDGSVAGAETPQGVAGSRSHKIFEIEVPTMNYDTLLSAAHDYISAYNDVRRTFPHGFTLWDSTLLHSEAAQKSICHDRCEAVFHALCECAGIPQEVLIQAARIEDRYYERGGTRCLDPERLIRSLL